MEHEENVSRSKRPRRNLVHEDADPTPKASRHTRSIKTPKPTPFSLRSRVADAVPHLPQPVDPDPPPRLPVGTGETHAKTPSRTKSISVSSTRSQPRSRSPTKRMVELLAADKKVERHGAQEGIRSLPTKIQELHARIHKVAAYAKGIVPMEIADDVARTAAVAEPLDPDISVARESSQLSLDALQDQLKALISIQAESTMCANENLNEASWNERVQYPMLRETVRHRPGVHVYNITTAKPLKELVPDNRYGDATAKKMVDYGITLGNKQLQADVIDRLGACTSLDMRRTINPTSYDPLCHRPLAISIETKTPSGGDEEEAMVQLCIWVTAHFNRLRNLLPAGERDGPLEIALPLILVSGPRWSLFFAHDTQDCIVSLICTFYSCLLAWLTRFQSLVTSTTMGETSTLLGCYKVLCALGMLCAWAEKEYAEWFRETILTPE